MKYLAPVIFIVLFAAGIHFVNKSTPLTSPTNGLEALDQKARKLQEKLDGQFSEEQVLEAIGNEATLPNEKMEVVDEIQEDRYDTSHSRDERIVIGDEREIPEEAFEDQEMDSPEIEEYFLYTPILPAG